MSAGSITVEVWAAEDRRERYPSGSARLASGASMRFVEPDENGRTPDAVVVDRPPAGEEAALGRASCSLLSLGSLAALTLAGWSGDSDGGWLPLMPAAVAEDVGCARRLAADELGAVQLVELVTCFGEPPSRVWEGDGYCPFDRHESVAFGLQLLETVCGGEVVGTRTVTVGGVADAFEHRIGSCAALQLVVPRSMTRSQGFKATAYCDHGRVLLRDEFAVGAVGYSLQDGELVRFPELPRGRPSGLGPETIRGGWETVRLLEGAISAGDGEDALRAQSLRLLAHMRDAIAADDLELDPR